VPLAFVLSPGCKNLPKMETPITNHSWVILHHISIERALQAGYPPTYQPTDPLTQPC
jgi:hypothetical protein